MPLHPALRIHHIEPASRVNGPGLRAVIWLQGCTLGCPGCFNPETHTSDGGKTWTTGQAFDQIAALGDAIQGVTLSGGEPLQQRPAVTALLTRIRRETGLSVVLFTGFEWQEVQRMPGVDTLLDCIDVLIAGRYRAAERVARSLTGSANKTFHFLTSRYTAADMQQVPAAEVILSPEGEVTFSGIDPLEWG